MNKTYSVHTCGSVPAGRFILAISWDRLGGRVHEILNGYVLAGILEIDFRFLWPEEKRFPEMCDQIKIFSEDFIQKHRLYENQTAGLQEILLPSSEGKSINEYKSLICDLPVVSYFRSSNLYKVPQFSDADLHNLFMQSASEVLSPEVLDLDRRVQMAMQEFGVSKVLHLRYGDLLKGTFRQYPEVNKYFPYCLAYKMLAQKEIQEKIILISDSPEILSCLTDLDHSYLTSDQLKINCSSRDEFEILILDLLIMKNCSTVLAPSLSAFSQLGTHLGGRELEYLSVGNQVSDIADTLDWIERHDVYGNLPEQIAGPLFARDIAQLMNTHSKFTVLKSWHKFALKASLSDPQYVVGSAQLAVAYSFLGEFSSAFKTLDKIRISAYAARATHEDPLGYLTVVEVFCSAIQMLQEMNKGNRIKSRLLSEQSLSLIQFLRTLRPFQIPLQDLIESLEKSFAIFQSELLTLESQKELELRINVLKQNPIIRRLFGTKTRYLPPEEIFSSIYCNVNDADFLVMLAETLKRLASLFESGNSNNSVL